MEKPPYVFKNTRIPFENIGSNLLIGAAPPDRSNEWVKPYGRSNTVTQ
ncbi:MAG: hypothetical protein ACYCT9_07820 [Leptospirillum sp.]